MAPSPHKKKSPKKTGKISTAYPKRKKITTFFKSDLLNSSQDIPLQGPSTSTEPIEIQGVADSVTETCTKEEAYFQLRQFDLDRTYGPCCGLSRSERYDRAVILGMNPPAEIPDLIRRFLSEDSHVNENVWKQYHLIQ